MMRALRSWVYSSFVLPRWEPDRYRGMGRGMRRYDKLSHCGQAELMTQGQAKLNEIFVHAYDTVPFYRERFAKAGYRRGDNVDSSGIRQIPILTPPDILAHRRDLWSRT